MNDKWTFQTRGKLTLDKVNVITAGCALEGALTGH